ncbi:aspartic peptidase domain-containing protein [Emericellopsis atlantica]|uniref:Aspartic peptidase domain-containing protein n=1 Tax=Emericellopsis atlantica TaxID=2614577 RepID=A0A9P7ZS25_9HYPO|nr:aspartic peptidase domain-containing protein [Emericellopsis atlantica]KAG9257185.1 aspartic peptidase domain-containing protein [Emericellopsis atlantica]
MRFVSLLCAAPLVSASIIPVHQALDSRDAVVNETAQAVPKANKRFSLGEVPNVDYKGGDAPLELIKAHTKYQSELPPWLRSVVESNPDLSSKFKSYLQMGGDAGMTGTVSASPPAFYDVQYVVPADIGTPPQRTFLNLDTGSSDLWTFSSDTYQPQVRNQILYRPQDSSTSELLNGESWSIRYGDGAEASGIVYQDRVALGGVHFDQQGVQSAVQVSSAISGDSFSSGIMGMAYTSGANTVRPTKQKTFAENIRDELESPVFTVNLQKGRPGNYNFGFIDELEHTGKIAYTKITDNAAFWKVPIAGYQVGDRTFRQYAWEGIVDTGTTLLLVPDDMVNDYYSAILGARYDPRVGMVVFPCDASVPDFKFGFGNFRGVIPGNYVRYGQYTGSDCFGGIQSSEGIGMAIIGDVLIKAQLVVFDMGNGTVGFANKQLSSD